MSSMTFDRRKFLRLALSMGAASAAAGCIVVPAQPNQPPGNPAYQQQPLENTSAPGQPASNQAQPGTRARPPAAMPADECVDWSPSGECTSWAGDSAMPADECVDWSPSGECIAWE